jgi:asparagine synthase (glutamine-hydrolysing)
MCGITGWIAFDRDLTGEGATIDAMTATMACRGPDARGTWLAQHALLGHRRLAVIDIEGGAQPMQAHTPGGPAVMVYSGETYNYTELRDELRCRGHHFRTESDTEVVLRGYLEWGTAVAERLNGMYALAIWDSAQQKLVMIRDRMGIKPFYYYPLPGGVLFGSEPKAILAHPSARRAVDLEGLHEMLTFAKTPRQAVWAGMREVLPGTVVTVDAAGLREQVYWRLETREHTDDQQASVRHVRDLLDDIVRRQLVADVPRCVLLSGGLDSSVLTALAAGQLGAHGEQVRSFAVDFTGQEENYQPDDFRPTPDAPFVREVAKHVNSMHADIVLDHTTLADPAVRREVITARDFPAGLGDLDGSLYLLFKAIREHSTVALSGESADEVFGGYAWFHQPEVQRADAFPWTAVTMTTGPAAQAEGLYAAGLAQRLDLPGYMHDRYTETLAEVTHLPGDTEHERRMRVICYAHLTRFVRMLLDRKDRMSMAVGLEVRVPFCDHRLVDYVYNTSWALKTYDTREKSLLRGATRDVLPRSVVERVKSPYPQTQDAQYPAALQRQAKEVLAAPGHPVFELISRPWLEDTVRIDPARIPDGVRNGLERVLDLAMWLDLYRPDLQLD